MPTRHRETITGGFDTNNVRTNYTRINCGSSWVAGSSSTTHTGTRREKFIDDCTIPGFHALIRKGRKLPYNRAVISDFTETRTASGSAIHSSSWNGTCYLAKSDGPAWAEMPPLLTVPPYDDEAMDIASATARSRCRASVFDALTTLAELNKTANMVGNSIRRFFMTASEVAERAARLSRRPGEAISLFSKLWLEYRYGWLPAVYSAEDALRAYNLLQSKREFIIEKALHTEEIQGQEFDVQETNLGGGGTQTIQLSETLSGQRRYCATALGIVNPSNAKYVGFDPLLTAWELVPYSFVVDWFLDVGDWINSISPFSGAEVDGGGVSVTTEYTWVQSWDISWGGTHSGSGGPVETVKQLRLYDRGYNLSGSDTIRWNPRINLHRVIDAAALVIRGRSRIARILRK